MAKPFLSTAQGATVIATTCGMHSMSVSKQPPPPPPQLHSSTVSGSTRQRKPWAWTDGLLARTMRLLSPLLLVVKSLPRAWGNIFKLVTSRIIHVAVPIAGITILMLEFGGTLI